MGFFSPLVVLVSLAVVSYVAGSPPEDSSREKIKENESIARLNSWNKASQGLESCVPEEDLADVFDELTGNLQVCAKNGEASRSNLANDTHGTYLSCDAAFSLCQGIVAQLSCGCLGNSNNSNSTNVLTKAEAYGYGFLIMMFLCAVALAAILVVPFLNENLRVGRFSKFLFSLLISMGVSALVCDAILHLIPHAFGLDDHDHDHDHEHDVTQDDHAHSHEIIWKGCALIGGMLAFFMFEVLLRSLAPEYDHTHSPEDDHTHSPEHDHTHSTGNSASRVLTPPPTEKTPFLPKTHSPSNYNHGKETAHSYAPLATSSFAKETAPEVTSAQNGVKNGQSSGEDLPDEVEKAAASTVTKTGWGRVCRYLRSVKPLAWVIVMGDTLHRVADGIALGAAISQSLGGGLSTAIAILFHEIPHVLGDYVILLSTGMTWYAALVFNLLSSLGAITGFFVGVSIGTDSGAADSWILAIIAGQFLYIALVDLLPELVHLKGTALIKCIQFVMSVIGFAIGFAVLLCVALYEEQLNSLIH